MLTWHLTEKCVRFCQPFLDFILDNINNCKCFLIVLVNNRGQHWSIQLVSYILIMIQYFLFLDIFGFMLLKHQLNKCSYISVFSQTDLKYNCTIENCCLQVFPRWPLCAVNYFKGTTIQ